MKKIFRAFGYPDVVWFPKSEHSFLTFICISFKDTLVQQANLNLFCSDTIYCYVHQHLWQIG